jgi:uncharacterized membrane protein YbjE (DUF340 family)
VCLAGAMSTFEIIRDQSIKIGSIGRATITGITFCIIMLLIIMLLFRQMIKEKNIFLRWTLVVLTFQVGIILLDIKTRDYILWNDEKGGSYG